MDEPDFPDNNSSSGLPSLPRVENSWMTELIKQAMSASYQYQAADESDGSSSTDYEDVEEHDDSSSGGDRPPAPATGTEHTMALLSRLVDLEHPVITDKMIMFLSQELTCRMFVGFITRMRPDGQRRADGESRDVSDLTAVRRSYRTMSVLCRSSDAIERLLSQRLVDVVKELFRIFNPASDGLLVHFSQVFQRLMRSKPHEMSALLLANDAEYIRILVDNAYISPVTECVVAVFRCLVESERKQRLFEAFHTAGLVQAVCRLSADEDPEVSSSASEACERILESLAGAFPNNDSNGWSVFPVGDRANEVLQMLVQAFAAAETTPQQKLDCIKTLHTYYFYWRRASQDPPGPFLPDTVTPYLASHLGDVCNAIVNISGKRLMQHEIKFNSYAVSNNITTLRLTGIRLVYLILTTGDNKDPPEEWLEMVPASYWKLLTTLFFTHEHSNIYHALFYRYFSVALRSNHPATIKNLLSKPKTITRLLEQYESNPKGSGGFVLLMLNMLRLLAQVQPPTSTLNEILKGNHHFQDIAPKLEEASRQHLVGHSCTMGLAGRMPRAQIGPRLARTEPPPSSPALTENSFCLGSVFSYHLGLGDAQPWVEPPKIEELTLENIMGTAPPQGKKKKKKKKKKTKKKKEDGEEDTEGGDDDHDSDGSEEGPS